MIKKLTPYWLLLFTMLALLFFSANSILAKVALVNNYIDAYSFTLFRILSGAITLLILIYIKEQRICLSKNKNWLTSFMLFLYAISFSYAYLSLEAGLGTLLLFGVVQLSMIIIALFKKERINLQKIIGISLAFSGLVYLLFPNEEFTLSFFHSFLMIISGIAWAIYTVLGKESKNALLNTTDNFVKATIFVIIFYLLFVDDILISSQGFLLAILSGSITSAVGYVMWYYVLPQLKIITASIIQLIVPVISIFFSIFFLNEKLTITLIISTLVILTGIAISIIKSNSSYNLSSFK